MVFLFLMADTISNLHFNGDTQCFPLYWYEETKQEKTLFDNLSNRKTNFMLVEMP
jgi:hypothetical protein